MADVYDQFDVDNVRIRKRYKDMGDGTHAEVISADGAASGSSATLPSGTDRSGAITLGGTAQTLAAANTSRLV